MKKLVLALSFYIISGIAGAQAQTVPSTPCPTIDQIGAKAAILQIQLAQLQLVYNQFNPSTSNTTMQAFALQTAGKLADFVSYASGNTGQCNNGNDAFGVPSTPVITTPMVSFPTPSNLGAPPPSLFSGSFGTINSALQQDLPNFYNTSSGWTPPRVDIIQYSIQDLVNHAATAEGQLIGLATAL